MHVEYHIRLKNWQQTMRTSNTIINTEHRVLMMMMMMMDDDNDEDDYTSYLLSSLSPHLKHTAAINNSKVFCSDRLGYNCRHFSSVVIAKRNGCKKANG